MNDEAMALVPLHGIEVRPSSVHGQGVFATRPVPAGAQIGPYAGRRYAADDVHDGWDDRLTYLFGLSDGSLIDGAQGGNATRHLNHACEPNVEAVEDYDAADQLVIAIHATRDIAAGEELFLDYALVVDGDDPAAYPCACARPGCRGTLVGGASVPAAPMPPPDRKAARGLPTR